MAIRLPLAYLLHFSEPVGNTSNPRAMAKHYLGHATDLVHRLWEHEHDPYNAGKLVYAAHERGITVSLVRCWVAPHPRPWLVEHGLKALKQASLLCPICNPDRYQRFGASGLHLIQKGIRHIQHFKPGYEPPPPEVIARMAAQVRDVPVSDAIAGMVYDPENPFAHLVTEAEIRAGEIERAVIERARRKRASAPPPPPIPNGIWMDGIEF